MADGVIEIIIGGDGGGGSESGSQVSGRKERAKNPHDAFVNKLDSLLHPGQTAKSKLMQTLKDNPAQIAQAGAILYMVKDMASTAWRYANMELNRSFSLKENYLAQNKMNMFHQQMGALKSTVSTIGSSVMMGAAAGGPWGAVAGLAYGVVKSAVDITVQKEQKMEQYNMQLNATNAQTQFSASRAALVNGSRGTEY